MWHNHEHKNKHNKLHWWCGHNHNTSSNIKIAFFLNLGFTIIEFIWGFLTNSIAIMADAIHDLWDTLSLWLAWKLETVSQKKKTKKYTYWYKRFSLLAAMINSIILIIWSIYVLSEAVPRLLSPEESNYVWMFFLALLWVAVNWYAAYKVMKWNSLNERTISWHLIEDVLWWVWILIVSIINFFIEVPILDPILAITFTIFILWNVIKNLKQVVKVFMQEAPSDVDTKKIEQSILKIKWISDIHDIRIWTMDSQDHIMTCHISISENIEIGKLNILKIEIKQILKNNKIKHSTIEFDIWKNECEYKNY